jgi:hypothetical protein
MGRIILRARNLRLVVVVIFGCVSIPLICGALLLNDRFSAPASARVDENFKQQSLLSKPRAKIDAADARRLLDDDPIHITQTFCVDAKPSKAGPGLTALRSMLAARATGASRNRRYVIHIFVDEAAAWLLANNRSMQMPHGFHIDSESLDQFNEQWGDVLAHIDGSNGRINLHMYPEDDAYAAVEQTLGNGSTLYFNHDGFKRCSPLRLTVPFAGGAMALASKVIHLDMDLIVLCDIEQVCLASECTLMG